MTDFSSYTDAVLSAMKNTAKEQDVISKKQGILDSIYDFHNFIPDTILFVGFNPAILSSTQAVYVTEISESARNYLHDKNVNFTYIDEDDLGQYRKHFDVVVAADEYFTYATDDQNQIDSVSKICSLAKEFVISTLRDYKNQDFKDREFSIPAVVRDGMTSRVYTEFHDWQPQNRSMWVSRVYEVSNPDSQATMYGPYERHTMYFKQLAKFSMDAGAGDFIVHKNLMYKSVIKKNYEHVISIRFD